MFKDEAVSGAMGVRKGFEALLKYLDKKPNLIVIVDDISRLARDVSLYYNFKNEIERRRARCISLNQQYDETPEGKLSENITASFAQYERDNNTRRVISRQKERLQQGFWVFRVPLGYYYPKGKDKIIKIDYEIRDIIIDLFEGYAAGRFQNYVEANLFLASFPQIKSKYKTGKVPKELSKKILTSPLYAGYIEISSKSFSISLLM